MTLIAFADGTHWGTLTQPLPRDERGIDAIPDNETVHQRSTPDDMDDSSVDKRNDSSGGETA